MLQQRCNEFNVARAQRTNETDCHWKLQAGNALIHYSNLLKALVHSAA